MLVIIPGVQFLHFNPQNSLLTTSLVSLFISYLNFIGQFSYGDDVCKRANVSSLAADIVCSTFLFLITMYGSIVGGTGQVRVTRSGDINTAMGVTGNQNQNVNT
jgi:hypothetical protein